MAELRIREWQSPATVDGDALPGCRSIIPHVAGCVQSGGADSCHEAGSVGGFAPLNHRRAG